MNIKAAILNWLGVPLSTTDTRLYHGGINTAGQCVSDETILSLSAVWACVRLLSQTVSTLPLRIYKDEGKRKVIDGNYPLDRIIHRKPNADSSAPTFWQAVIATILLRGGAYIEVSRMGGMPTTLRFLWTGRLQVTEYNGVKEYAYLEKNGEYRKIPPSKIVYIPGFTLDGENGVSAIRYGAATFGNALAANTAANSTFKNGLMPTIYIKQPTVVKQDQREDFRKAMKEVSGALNAGKTPVLEGGQEFGEVGISPEDAQLLESRSFSVEEICRWFGVPAFMIGHTQNTTTWGTGLEQINLSFLTYTLRPLLNFVEQAVNNQLIPIADQARYSAEYNIEALLRADSAGRAAFYSTMTQNGIMTRDEARVKENLEPKGGNADVLTVQSALMPLDSLGVKPQ